MTAPGIVPFLAFVQGFTVTAIFTGLFLSFLLLFVGVAVRLSALWIGADVRATRTSNTQEHTMRRVGTLGLISVLGIVGCHHEPGAETRAELERLRLEVEYLHAKVAACGIVPSSADDEALARLQALGREQQTGDARNSYGTGVRLLPAFRGDEPIGLKVLAVRPDGLWRACGVHSGDVITRANDVPVRSLSDAASPLRACLAGQSLQILRNGQATTLAPRPMSFAGSRDACDERCLAYIQEYVESLKVESPQMIQFAVDTLLQMGGRAVPYLLGVLASDTPVPGYVYFDNGAGFFELYATYGFPDVGALASRILGHVTGLTEPLACTRHDGQRDRAACERDWVALLDVEPVRSTRKSPREIRKAVQDALRRRAGP